MLKIYLFELFSKKDFKLIEFFYNYFIHLIINKMKKIGKLKLNRLSKNALDERQQNALKGGVAGCICVGCVCPGDVAVMESIDRYTSEIETHADLLFGSGY